MEWLWCWFTMGFGLFWNRCSRSYIERQGDVLGKETLYAVTGGVLEYLLVLAVRRPELYEVSMTVTVAMSGADETQRLRMRSGQGKPDERGRATTG